MKTRGDRRGFTLTELAVVVMVVGILAGLAIPNLRRAALRAEAASIVADARIFSQAIYAYHLDTGTFPRTGFRSPPPELEPYLPDNFPFDRGNDVTYMWLNFSMPSANNPWGSRNMGFFRVSYARRPALSEVMRAHQGPEAIWSGTVFYFVSAA